jgi:phosphatidylglycerophosphate synthase
MTQSNFNLANTLSISRIVFLPLLYLFAFIDMKLNFLVGYLILGATDALDGWVARTFHQVTHLGKILDTVADILFYFSTLFFIVYYYPNIIEPNTWLLVTFLGFYVGAYLLSWIKIGKPMQIHTNILRFCATLVYFLMIVSFITDATWFVSLILIVFIIGYIEEIAIFLLFGKVDVDTRSILPLLKKRKETSHGL